MKDTMNTYVNDNDGYDLFEANLKQHFQNAIAGGKKLFKTNVLGLFDIYLNNLPEEARQHYTCNTCRHFIDRFGGLVTIDEDGIMTPVMWDEDTTPPFFQAAVSAIVRAILNAKVSGVFIAESQVLGIPRTGEWTHLSVTAPRELVNSSRLLSAGQAMAEKREEFNMLINALNDYSIGTVDQAVALLQSETMYRSDRVLGIAEWFQALVEKRNRASGSKNKENIVWLAVATAPTGFCHVRSSMIGTLLDDIAAGLSADSISRRFAEKMSSGNYMRSQAAPSANKVREDEKIVVKLGLETALQRRYASFDEIPEFLWKDNSPSEEVKQLSSVFSHIMPKEATENSTINLPQSVMTWDKFQRTVMPTAQSLEVLIDNPDRLMAMVTAADPTAENILQWNNPFSWYYHGGVDAEIKRRVEEFGGRHEDNEIRVSLIWDGLTDLDLHCITPYGDHIYYSDKRGRCDGYLDLDMNGLDKNSSKPVENMRWANNAPQGRYQFYVHNYNERVNGRAGTPFRVELEVNGKIYHYEGQALKDGQKITVFDFNYQRGQDPAIAGGTTTNASNVDSWNLQANSFVKVNGITVSPNLWDGQEMSHAGTHVFFLLDGVKDTSEGKGRGFFNEMLKSDLRQIRKTLEAYTASTPIQGAEEATACGVGYAKDNEWNVTVKVTANNSTRVIKIDRWD